MSYISEEEQKALPLSRRPLWDTKRPLPIFLDNKETRPIGLCLSKVLRGMRGRAEKAYKGLHS